MSLAGRTISHYKVVEEIRRDGIGIVYRATDTRLDRDVAFKVLPAELTNDPDRRERLMREARAAAGLEHPNIAVIYDVGDQDGVCFIATELVHGDTLAIAIQKGVVARSPGRAIDIATQIAEAVARAHMQSVVHGDLTAANVLLTEDMDAKIVDFGLAKLLAPPAGDAGAVDHRTDIYSFGILLNEMFGGTLPPSAAPALQRIIDNCLGHDPGDQDMNGIVAALRAARHAPSRAPSLSLAGAASLALNRVAQALRKIGS